MNSGHPATAWDENEWFYGRRTESISRQPNVMNSYILTQRRCAFSTSYRWCGSFVILRVIIHIHLLAGRRPLLCFRIPIYKLVENRDKGISWERYKALVCFPEQGELSSHRTETMAERLAHWVLHCVAINHKSLLRFIPLEHRIVLVFARLKEASWDIPSSLISCSGLLLRIIFVWEISKDPDSHDHQSLLR